MTFTLTFTWKFQKGKQLIIDLYCLECFCTKRLCSYALNYVFWPLGLFLKIKGPLKGPSKGIFFKSLKAPHNGIKKTLCAKNKVCKSISMTCSTYRRITKDKEENTPKWPKKGPQRAKNQNFEKQKIKTLTSSGRTHRQTDRQTHRDFNHWGHYQGFSL